MLQKHGCLHKYKIPPSLLESLLAQLELGYASNSNPYHNNLHASDVLQEHITPFAVALEPFQIEGPRL